MIVNFYYIRLIKNIYMSYKKNNNLAFFLNKYSYFFCIVTMFLQFLLYYLLLNSSFIRNLIHILILDFVNVL